VLSKPHLRQAQKRCVPYYKTKSNTMTKPKFVVLTLLVGQFLLTSCGNSRTDNETKNISTADKPNEEQTELILDLRSIAGKTLVDVETILGKAESKEKVKGYPCEKSKCERAFFKSGNYEVIFKSDKADRITINNVPDLTNSDNAIEKLGLQVSAPTFKNANNVIRWTNTENINEISFFTNYILIQVSKPD
jgi:hypothetical protein